VSYSRLTAKSLASTPATTPRPNIPQSCWRN